MQIDRQKLDYFIQEKQRIMREAAMLLISQSEVGNALAGVAGLPANDMLTRMRESHKKALVMLNERRKQIAAVLETLYDHPITEVRVILLNRDAEAEQLIVTIERQQRELDAMAGESIKPTVHFATGVLQGVGQ